jgi:hypothetical protein
VSLRHDQLIPVNKAVNEKEQLEKGLEEEEKKKFTPGDQLHHWDQPTLGANFNKGQLLHWDD